MTRSIIIIISIGLVGIFNFGEISINAEKLNSGRRVVGGISAPITAFPWQIGLYVGKNYLCGGSILSQYYVLTAAHCTNKKNPNMMNVRYGSDRLFHGAAVSVIRLHQHKKFNRVEGLGHDISVLELKFPIQFSQRARPVILRYTEAREGETAMLSGWGAMDHIKGKISQNLKAASTRIINWQQCSRSISRITHSMICAYENRRGHCNGDSGGPLVIRNKQVGIVSFKINDCANPEYPEVYTNVAFHRRFIDIATRNTAMWG